MSKTKAHIIIQCPGCGKDFDSNNRDITHNHRKFCTRQCYFSYRKRWRVIKCEKCGKTFERHNAKRRYCSRECFNNANADKEVFNYKTYLSWGYPTKQSKMIHVSIAEKILGRRFKKGEVVHHINCKKDDYRNSNLIVCTQSYHRFLHDRMSKKYAEVFLL